MFSLSHNLCVCVCVCVCVSDFLRLRASSAIYVGHQLGVQVLIAITTAISADQISEMLA